MALNFNSIDLGTTLVIGGCGWVGDRLVKQLVDLGIKVVVADIAKPQTRLTGVSDYWQVDIRDTEKVSVLLEETRPATVFLVAAVIDIRPCVPPLVYEVNVGGTKKVTEACVASKTVRRLVYTSSLDVAAHMNGMSGVDEDEGYPEEYHTHYQKSKIEAEKIVLAANEVMGMDGRSSPMEEDFGVDKHVQRLKKMQNRYGLPDSAVPESPKGMEGVLATIAVRPSHVWGDGDPVLDFSTSAPVHFTGECRMSMQFVDNVAYAHVLAGMQLAKNPARFGGKAYFFSDFAVNFQDHYFEIVQKKPFKVPNRFAPFVIFMVFRITAVLDFFARLLFKMGINMWPDPVRVFSTGGMLECCQDLYVSGARAINELGYSPPVSKEEGIRRAREWYAKSKGFVKHWIA